MSYIKITEQSSLHDNLDQLSTLELLQKMNEEDKKVANALTEVIPNIEKLVEALVKRFDKGGRLFYIGAGTSGYLQLHMPRRTMNPVGYKTQQGVRRSQFF